MLPPSLLRVGLFNTSQDSYFSIKLKNTHPRERFQRRGITFIVFFFSFRFGLAIASEPPVYEPVCTKSTTLVAVTFQNSNEDARNTYGG